MPRQQMSLSNPMPDSLRKFAFEARTNFYLVIKDYYATIYSAEIVNTLTNLLFMALGIKGIRNCLKYDHDNVFLVAFIGYLLVGSGSFLFHSTLKCWSLAKLAQDSK